MKQKEIIIFTLLILVGVISRLIPHAPNIAAIGAISLFSGYYFSRKTAVFIPLLAMFISDVSIGFYEPKLMLVVYASFALMTLCGSLSRRLDNWNSRIIVMLFGSCLFFLTTNFAVWAFSYYYADTLSGLLYAYTMALPFFRNSLLGDMGYSSIIFGLYILWKSRFSIQLNFYRYYSFLVNVIFRSKSFKLFDK